MNKYFNQEVKKGLKKKGISMRELGRETGLDVSFLSKILSGKRNPPSKENDIKKIASTLDIMPEKLIFSAGKVPKNLIATLKDEKIIEYLKSGDIKKTRGKRKSKKDSSKPKKESSIARSDIDDTIL